MRPLRIAALVGDPWDRDAIRKALRSRPSAASALPLQFMDSWPELLSEACKPRTVVLVDPESDKGPTHYLGLLHEACSPHRVVLYMTASTPPDVMRRTDHHHDFPLRVHTVDAGDILDALAIAGSAALFDAAIEGATDLSAEARRILRTILTVGDRSWGIHGIASRLHTSNRHLRRRCHEFGLPPPSRLIGWSRMCRLAALSALGVRRPSDLAEGVGYVDVRSVDHVSLTILRERWGDIDLEDMVEQLTGWLVRQVSG